MKIKSKKSGFSAVELLITLFVASIFLVAGYQLYTLIIEDNGETRAQATADNVAYKYLKQYEASATNPCSATTPLTDQSITVDGLASVTVSVAITCPYSTNTTISKINVTIDYNGGQSQQEASYVSAE